MKALENLSSRLRTKWFSTGSSPSHLRFKSLEAILQKHTDFQKGLFSVVIKNRLTFQNAVVSVRGVLGSFLRAMKFQRGPTAPRNLSLSKREIHGIFWNWCIYLQGQSHSSETFMKAAAEPRRDLAEVTDPKKKIIASKNCSQNKLRITKIRKLSKKKTKNQLQHEFFSFYHFLIIFVTHSLIL